MERELQSVPYKRNLAIGLQIDTTKLDLSNQFFGT
jgi:hypothetical protein